MLERGIRPLATLYHWDLPQALQDEGGWASRDIVGRFTEYAAIVFDHLGDLVSDWITHNEPWVTSILGYAYGVKAPGISDWPTALRAAHHSLLAHGAAVEGLPRQRRDGQDRHHARPDRREPGDPVARGRGGRRPAGRPPQPLVPRPGLPSVLPGGDGRAVRAAGRPARLRPRRRPRADRAADRLPRRELLPAEPRRGGRRRIGARPPRGRRRRRAHSMGWPVIPTALTELLVRLQRDYGERAVRDHRERRRLRRPPRRRRRGRGRAARRLHRRATSRRSSAPASRASTSAATTSGRCSTTSSGSTATPSASASCSSTSRPSGGSRSEARSGTGT